MEEGSWGEETEKKEGRELRRRMGKKGRRLGFPDGERGRLSRRGKVEGAGGVGAAMAAFFSASL